MHSYMFESVLLAPTHWARWQTEGSVPRFEKHSEQQKQNVFAPNIDLIFVLISFGLLIWKKNK